MTQCITRRQYDNPTTQRAHDQAIALRDLKEVRFEKAQEFLRRSNGPKLVQLWLRAKLTYLAFKYDRAALKRKFKYRFLHAWYACEATFKKMFQ